MDGERAIALAPQWATGYYRKGSALAGLKVGIYAHTTRCCSESANNLSLVG